MYTTYCWLLYKYIYISWSHLYSSQQYVVYIMTRNTGRAFTTSRSVGVVSSRQHCCLNTFYFLLAIYLYWPIASVFVVILIEFDKSKSICGSCFSLFFEQFYHILYLLCYVCAVLPLVDRPTQLICIFDIYLLSQQTSTKDIAGQSAVLSFFLGTNLLSL